MGALRVRIGIDGTPLLGQRTGIGNYTAHLLTELAELPSDHQLTVTAFTFRGRDGLREVAPQRVRVAARPAPARLLRAAWSRSALPPVEWLIGQVDVFHATNFVLPPARRARGVLTVHDLAYLKYPHTVSSASLAYQQLVPRGIARAQVVCTPSHAVAQQLQDAYRIDSERVVVTPLGVDEHWHAAEPLTAAQRQGLSLGADYIVAVGTIEPRKNLQLLLWAYRDLLRTGADLPPLVLVGGSGWGQNLDLAGITDDRLIMPGHLPAQQLRSLVAGARLLVFPSLDEGFGLPPLEALACGVPVIASDLPVTREVLGEHARFFAADDREALMDALISELHSPLGSADARRAHARTFTWRACAEATLGAYQRAMWA